MNGRELRIATATGAIAVGGEHRNRAAGDILLLYPEAEFYARGVTAGPLTLYIRDMSRVIADVLTTHSLPEIFQVVVAVRPGGRSRVWSIPQVLRTPLEAIQPLSVEGKQIAFMIRTRDDLTVRAELPSEWVTAADALTSESKRPGVSVDEVLDRVWPA